jgi:hypothetical protein
MSGPPSTTELRSLTWNNRAGARLQAAVGCAAAVLALVACTGPGGDPTPNATTPTPLATTSRPTPAPSTSAPPTRPAAMDRQDVEGAIAAAQYFLELYPYVYNTGDLTEWRAMSHPDCVFCARVIKNVEELHGAGGYETGGGFTVEQVTARSPIPGNDFFAVDVTVTQHAGEEFDAEGRRSRGFEGGDFTVAYAISLLGSQWSIGEVSIERTQ